MSARIQTIVIYLSMIVMATMKLTGLVTWSWWVVTAPLWGFIVLTIGSGIIIGAYRGLKIRIVKSFVR